MIRLTGAPHWRSLGYHWLGTPAHLRGSARSELSGLAVAEGGPKMASVAPRIDLGEGRRPGRWRPRRPHTRRGSALLTGAAIAIALFVPVAASEFLDGDSPEVAVNDTVEGDLYAVGRDVEIAGTVTKDLFVAAESLTIADGGEVGGSVN